MEKKPETSNIELSKNEQKIYDIVHEECLFTESLHNHLEF
jgi:hypothetical protein